MKLKMVVSRGPRQGFDKVMFPAKMREKGTGVALTNGSSMTKSVDFLLFLRELECNSVCLNVHTYSLSTAVGGLIMSVTDGSLSMVLLAILSNVYLSLNGGLTGS